MRSARREFIKQFGVALASLMMARCVVPKKGSDEPHDRLRDCWTRFGWLAEKTRQAKSPDQVDQNQAGSQLLAEHEAALDALVAVGELDQAVADQVHQAFGAAVYHVWRSNAPITCYEPMMVDYKPSMSNQLVGQAQVLAGLARESDVDPNVVAQAQAALERDITFLNLPQAEVQALYERMLKAREAGSDIPSFDQVELQVSPEAARAARFLVELLVEG